jgi:hypothetical protein
VRKVLFDAQAVSVCHGCFGNGSTCTACRGLGWLPVRGWSPPPS